MTRTEKIVFGLLLLLILVLIFFRLDRPDMVADEGHYAFRALGYFDYLSSYKQSTPIQWFGYRPWWSYLSFHDHTPLYFAIQHAFFALFGASMFVARLTSACCSIGSAVLVFLISRQKDSLQASFLSLGALAVNSYFVWTGRLGLLESALIFFALLGVFFLRKSEKDAGNKYFLIASLFFGLAFLTKISFMFIGLGIFLFFAFSAYRQKSWSIFKQRKALFGVLVFLAAISPYLIYNAEMQATRGHFDIQMSDLLQHSDGAVSPDWPLLHDRINAGGLPANLWSVVRTLVDGFSLPYALVLLWACGYIAYRLFAKKEEADVLPLFILLGICTSFSFVGASAAWLGVASPFAALVLGQALGRLPRTPILFAGVGIVALYSLFYCLNTNLMLVPYGNSPWTYASMRAENNGYRQLDARISSILGVVRPSSAMQEVVRLGWYKDFKPEAIQFPQRNPALPTSNDIVVYDLNTDWFNTVWIFDRWKFYDKFLAITTEDFAKSAVNPSSLATMRKNISTMYFIEASPELEKASGIGSPWTARIAATFKIKNIQPEVVKDDRGKDAFYIYAAPLSEVFTKPLPH